MANHTFNAVSQTLSSFHAIGPLSFRKRNESHSDTHRGKKNHLIFKDGNHEKMGREAKAIIDRLDWLSEGVNEPRSTVRGRRGQRESEGRRLSLMRTEQVVREQSEAQGAGCPLAGRRGAFLLREPFTQY